MTILLISFLQEQNIEERSLLLWESVYVLCVLKTGNAPRLKRKPNRNTPQQTRKTLKPTFLAIAFHPCEPEKRNGTQDFYGRRYIISLSTATRGEIKCVLYNICCVLKKKKNIKVGLRNKIRKQPLYLSNEAIKYWLLIASGVENKCFEHERCNVGWSWRWRDICQNIIQETADRFQTVHDFFSCPQPHQWVT